MAISKVRELELASRRKVVSAKLVAGETYREIAEFLNVSIGTVANDVKLILGRWQREQITNSGEYARLEVRRLDLALNAIWDKVITGGDLYAIDRLLKISERKAKLLGLDRPFKVAPTNPDGTERYAIDRLTDAQRASEVLALIDILKSRSTESNEGPITGGSQSAEAGIVVPGMDDVPPPDSGQDEP